MMGSNSWQRCRALARSAAGLGWHAVLPKKLLTRAAGRLASRKDARYTSALVGRFVRHYGVNLAEAHYPQIRDYATFNDFFSRRLKRGIRAISDAPFVCPVDGVVTQFGHVVDGQLLQAKGHCYSIADLLAGDAGTATAFERGSYATFYLSPKDYHRVHMPCDGDLERMVYVPGRFYSVNLRNAAAVPGLFARNERVLCFFRTAGGPLAVAFVGATIVGSVATVWHGRVRSPTKRRVHTWQYPSGMSYGKGAEIGYFLVGSTVILLFAQNLSSFNPAWREGMSVRLGEALGGN